MEPRYPRPLRHELDTEQLRDLLLWCVEAGASDIVLCPGDRVWLQRDGRWHAVTDTPLSDAEVQAVVNVTSGQSNRAGHVRAGHSLDYAFGVRVPGERALRQRFRVNATSSNKGIYVVMRVLPRKLPDLADMDLEPALEQALYPDAGLVVVSGVMGSGKSTLLAAILHKAVLSRGCGRQILTLEDPVEFDFSGIPSQDRCAPVTQSAIGVDVEDWAAGVRTLTRRKGEIVMVGECRDRETITSLLSTVEQGVTAYTTVHAQDVPQTLTRLIHLFASEERAGAAAVLFANTRLLIHQRLVPRLSPDGAPAGRLALREYLIVDENVRERLYELPEEKIVPGVRRIVLDHGVSLVSDARRRYAQGLVSARTLAGIVREQEGAGGPWRVAPTRHGDDAARLSPRP